MKKTLFIGLTCITFGVQAQDVHFSQVYNNPLHINPANVGGFYGNERIVLNYRSQWASSNSPFRTMGFSFDMPMFQQDNSKAHLGLGLSVFNDVAGDSKFSTTAPALTVAAIVPINRNSFFTTAIQAGYTSRSINLSSVSWGTQYNDGAFDPTLPSLENQSSVSDGTFDLGGGLRYSFEEQQETFQEVSLAKFDIGFGAYHITQPKLTFLTGDNQLYMRLVGHASARINMKTADLGFMPFFVGFFQGPYQEMNAGMLVRWKLSDGTKVTGYKTETALYIGGHYRLNDAIVPQVMFEYGSWGIGVSYDMTTSTYKTVNNLNGGLEISLKWHDLKGVIFKNRVNSRVN